jgi:hypothetical protein
MSHMKRVVRPIVAGGVLALTVSLAFAQDRPSRPNDYSAPESWLCRPGRDDACRTDETATIVAADGTTSREPWKPASDPPIDCFYVYPTVSTEPTVNADMTPGDAERNVVRHQFARFASVCRTYAPMYRQVTLAGLRRMLDSRRVEMARGIGYEDVRDAFRYYLEHDNRGRGFVLIGHSQGSIVLTSLIRDEIDGKPIQSRLVSAILVGTTIAVPRGADVGGTFEHVPLCRAAAQTGCVITFASFRSTAPPPPDALFGRVTANGQVAACTNPAALAGGSGDLRPYFDASGRIIALMPRVLQARRRSGHPIDTPWVTFPHLLTAMCAANENASGYLEVSVRTDRRSSDGSRDGDPTIGPNMTARWGLHVLDVELTLGNLIDIVGRQAERWIGRSR